MLALISTIASLLISLLIFVILIGIVVGIILAVLMNSESDPAKKAKLKKWMKWSFFGPVLTLILVVVINGLIQIIAHTVTG